MDEKERCDREIDASYEAAPDDIKDRRLLFKPRLINNDFIERDLLPLVNADLIAITEAEPSSDLPDPAA